jgi:hypothetical protein
MMPTGCSYWRIEEVISLRNHILPFSINMTKISAADLRYWTPKHNPLTSFLFGRLTEHRGKNLEWLIFTATTGRSGTMSLARIFSAVDSCASYHEPWPDMHGEELVNLDVDNNPYARFLYKTVKSVNIRRYARGMRYYFEANHMFIKSFYPYVLEDFPGKIKVIHLFRDPVKVANSIYSLGHYPGNETGNMWYLDYRAPSNKIRVAEILDGDENYDHVFYKCLWYWYEIEERVKDFREQHPNVPVVDFRTEDLNDQDSIMVMLDKLGVPYDIARIVNATGVRENLMSTDKQIPPLDTVIAEDMHQKFIELLAKLGYCVWDRSS